MMKWLIRIIGFIFVAENMPNVIDRLLEVVRGVWAIVSGVSVLVTRQVREFVNTMIIVLGLMALAIIVGFIFKLKVIIVFAGITSSLMILVGWRISNAIIEVGDGAVDFLGKKIVGADAKKLAESLRKLLHPFLVTSMILAFIASIVAVKGVGFFSLNDFIVWAAVLTFIGTLTIWLNSRIKISGYVMVIVLSYFMLGTYFWPIQVGGVVGWIESALIDRSLSMTQESLPKKMVKVPNGTPLYDYEKGAFVNASAVGTFSSEEFVGKVIDMITDHISEEVMYKIIKPVGHKYVGGSVVYVSARDVDVYSSSAVGNAGRQAQGPVEYGKEGDYTLDVNHGVSDWVVVKDGFVYSLSGDGEVQPFHTGGYISFWQAENLPKPGETFRVHVTNGQNVVLRVRVREV